MTKEKKLVATVQDEGKEFLLIQELVKDELVGLIPYVGGRKVFYP